ncbi:uncharacterized protein BDW70DRAFT_164937 [Aspergillus foveolatus]|uniref:uncharacterized protein n=1 Tax=Aspergillus foveolatus TaxID=210207 RepID=UPI003CCCA338
MARTQDGANVAPLSTDNFEPGAIRLHLNMGRGRIVSLLPPEEAHRNTEPVYTGETDEILFEDEEGWSFETDLNGVKEHICSFPFVSEDLDAFIDLLAELDVLLGDGRLARGYWPAKLILATRR